MKKIVLALILCVTLFSCHTKKLEDVRKVRVGISTNELKYIMGEPFSVELTPTEEVWRFGYLSPSAQTLRVTVVNNSVTNFVSY